MKVPPTSATFPALTKAAERRTLENYSRLPLSFVENQGQLDKDIAYYAQGPSYSFAFARGRVLMSLAKRDSSDADQRAVTDGSLDPGSERVSRVTLALEFVNANDDVSLEARTRVPGKVNYLIGDDPEQWHTGPSSYREVVYRDLWDGIDMVFHGSDGEFKYDLVVSPHASIDDIRLAYEGVSGLSLDG